MGKVRVYELARELGMEDSKPLMRILRDMGYKVKTASSGLSPDAVRKIREVVAPHIEQARREALERKKKAEEEKAKKAAKAAKPSRVVRIGSRPTAAQKRAIMDRHRRKLAGETLTESAHEVMQTSVEPEVAVVAEAAPETVEMPAVSVEEASAQEGAAVAVAESVAETAAEPELTVEEQEAQRHRELPPDQAIAVQYREEKPAPPPPPPPSSPAPAKAKEERATTETRGKSSKRGARTREITQQSRMPRRQPFRSARPGGKRRKKSRRRQAAAPKIDVKKAVELPEMISVGDLATRLDVPASDVIKYLLKQGRMVTINQGIDYDEASKIVAAYGFEVSEAEDELPDLELLEEVDEENPEDRPPVVTVLGHVDHGKTSLLDAIRQTNVTAGEAGGITQRIGAYTVNHHGKPITFIDTPGHEAFTQMRARGAGITDIAVLVVAADDGVMPQTVEAINHARAAGVPILVAMNKMDKPQANPDRIMQQLAEHNLVVEAWGGDVICVQVSALKNTGLDDLLEMILLVADMQELGANSDRDAQGVIIEAGLDKGLGPVATVLVKNGTLKVGDTVVVGDTWGRVRGLLNADGKRIRKAGPSIPASIVGLSDVPEAGDRLLVVDDEKIARQLSEARTEKSRVSRIRTTGGRTTLEELFSAVAAGQQKELKVLIKADGHGSVEALKQSLEKLSTDEVRVEVVHAAVGAISESDVMLASASDAIVIGFNVRPGPAVKRLADQEQVELRLYNVIYHAIEEVRKAMAGLLAPDIHEVELGRVEIRQIFKISRYGKVAGCYVLDGKVTRDAEIRLVRDGILIYEGKLDSLKRFKDDVREVAEGYECGLTIENYSDIQEGDIIEAYKKEAVARETI